MIEEIWLQRTMWNVHNDCDADVVFLHYLLIFSLFCYWIFVFSLFVTSKRKPKIETKIFQQHRLVVMFVMRPIHHRRFNVENGSNDTTHRILCHRIVRTFMVLNIVWNILVALKVKWSMDITRWKWEWEWEWDWDTFKTNFIKKKLMLTQCPVGGKREMRTNIFNISFNKFFLH